jgi:hypothetical protein
MKRLLIFAILALLYSCKGETYKIWTISNSASVNIIVSFRDIKSNEAKEYTISPSKSMMIYKVTLKGIVTDEGNPSLALKDLDIKNISGSKCTKDHSITSNWNIMQEKKTPPAKNYISYTFFVEDADF